MGFLGGAALLTAAVAVSKLLGALYKIPLGNLLGSRGMGCFQAAYNVYGVLLTLSTAGLPLAMSRLIAQSRGRPRRQRRIFHVALALFLALGLVGSGVMLTFPRQLAGLLHNELAAPSIRVLAPALLAGVSAVRHPGLHPRAGADAAHRRQSGGGIRREAGGGAGPYVVSPDCPGRLPGDRGRRGHGRCYRRLTAGAAGSGPAVAALLHGAATLRPPGGRCWVSC